MTGLRTVEVSQVGDLQLVTAGAGVKMGQLQNEILAKGLTLRVPPGNPAYTVGGCIATGCHNLGQSHAQDLQGLTLVTHNGTIRRVKRGDADFDAAAVSIGRLGVIASVSLEVLPYRSLSWSAEEFPIPSVPDVIKRLGEMTKSQTSRETVGNKLVFYLNSGAMMVEHWVPTGRAADPKESEPLAPYINTQPFRVGQGALTSTWATLRTMFFGNVPRRWLELFQVPAELAFKGLHTAKVMASVRSTIGWQHSPESRGEGSAKPTGMQFTWAGWLDEVTNLLMGLRHVEVIFPLEPMDKAERCLDIVLKHKHLAWWRLNVRTQQSEGYYLSSTYAEPGAKPVTFLRVDFVAPGGLMALPDGEASLTSQLRKGCPGWRKHWGKGLFTTAAEDSWGDAGKFIAVAEQWDPDGKFVPRDTPAWTRK